MDEITTQAPESASPSLLNDAPATPAVTGENLSPVEAQTPADWRYSEEVQGVGDRPEWFNDARYKTVEEQAKAHPELEKKFGGFTGAPEKYEVTLHEDIPEGIKLDPDSEEFQAFAQLAKDSNMNNQTFNGIINQYMKSMSAAESREIPPAVIEEHRKSEIEKLGENGSALINEVSSWGKNNLSDDEFDAFRGLADTADNLQLLKKIISKTSSSKVEANVQTAPPFTHDDLKTLIGDPRYLTDQKFQNEVDNKYRQLKDSGRLNVITSGGMSR